MATPWPYGVRWTPLRAYARASPTEASQPRSPAGLFHAGIPALSGPLAARGPTGQPQLPRDAPTASEGRHTRLLSPTRYGVVACIYASVTPSELGLRPVTPPVGVGVPSHPGRERTDLIPEPRSPLNGEYIEDLGQVTQP